MSREYDDISDLKKMIRENTNPDNGMRSRIYSLAKNIIDHDRRYTKKELTNVRTIMSTLPYITKKQKTSLKRSSLQDNDDDCYDSEDEYYSYCCNGQGD